MDNIWRWESWEGMPYLTCSLLERWRHGFFTKEYDPRSPEELVEVLDPNAKVYRVKQVHGNDILYPGEVEVKKEADGIISDRDKQAVWVASADCIPVLIGDVNTSRVAAVHAGWRGTAKKIVPNAIAHFIASGSSLDDIRIAMGPAISGEVYQVDEEVAVEIGKSIVETENSDNILQQMWDLPESPLSEDPEPGKVRIDAIGVNEIQIEKLGINKDNVAIASVCTYRSCDRFFSYRRSKEKKVQWSGIVS